MKIIYKEVHKILEEKNIEYPEFGCLNTDSNAIKVMQWQPKGVLSFEQRKGFCCAELEHAEKAEGFIREAYDRKADIVISPEYSFPWDTLEKIIEDKTLQPKNGKLYCLGMEGISCEELINFIGEYNDKNGLCIIWEELNDLIEKYFVSCLVYVFKSKEKMVCVIQLKRTHASDKWINLESLGLTGGKTVYLFKSKNGNNYIVSFICADVLSQEIESLKSEVSYEKCLILHPQLNPIPLHDAFEQMRKNFLDYDTNTRIIGLNWAKDTTLPAEGFRKEIILRESFSAFYTNGEWKYEESDDRTILIRNKIKGIDLAVKNHTIIWYMPDGEHCMLYSLDGFHDHLLNNAAARHKEPLGEEYFEYCREAKRWKVENGGKVCRVDWTWLNNCFRFEKCDNDNCKIGLLYHFFRILLIGRENYDFILDRAQVQTIFNASDALGENLVALRAKCTYPDKALKAGNIPVKFQRLEEGNYEWILDPKGNLKEKDSLISAPVCSVIFVDSDVEELIRKNINRFCNYMGDEACDRLIVYYSSSEGTQFYDKHYNNDINNPDNYNSVNSIK